MATIKKNQLANIVFPMVDGTDFASVESGLTASDFESKVTKKYFGVTHGNSTAFTSGTISKAATLVRSGIFQQTLKAAETNFDYVLYSFAPANTSLAHQMLVFQPVDYDDSDIFSQLSDIGSNLLSYLTGMSGAISDVQSALDSQFLIITSNISDIDSQLTVTHSLLSDVESQVDLLATSNYLSTVHSDLRSQISGLTVNVTASDMSDIASRVWATTEGTRVDSRILVIQSLISDVDSQLLLNASVISDVYSLLSDHHSDFQSRVAGTLATSNQLSQVQSDLRSYLVGLSGAISDIESQLDLTASVVSDIDSQLTVTHSLVSDIESQVDLLATSNYLSTVHSDLRSQISGITASVGASDISDIASAVWANTIGARVDSRIVLIQSNVSDVESQLDLTASTVSDVYSLLSDHHSDFQSRVAGTLATSNQLSQVQSDLRSYLVGLSGAVSDIESQLDVTHSLVSDIDSQLTETYSLISDVDSQLTVTHSLVSDIDSQLTATTATVSDISSRIPAALVSGRMSADAVAISGSTAAADNLEASAEVIVVGTAQTGTLSTTQMTTDLTEATNDHYIGRVIIWTSGVLLGQATNITDYAGTNGLLTFTAVTEAPSNGDTFVIV